jgi:hypothetical protein
VNLAAHHTAKLRIAKKYLPFTADQVTDEMRAETVLFTAVPHEPYFSRSSMMGSGR